MIAVMTLFTLATAGVLVQTLESARIDRSLMAQIEQEDAEFRRLQRDPVDPVTLKPITSVDRLLEIFLGRNVPDDDEMLVAYQGETHVLATANRYGRPVLNEPEYRRTVRQALDDGGTVRFESPTYGEVWVTAIPVIGQIQEQRGALVIVNFVEDERSELTSTMRTYTIVSILALLLISTLGALQSGRLLAPLHTLRRTAAEITAQDLSGRIPERGNDDITELTRTINTMLDRLEAGFEQQRQFLDDAGHELKTPLTVVSGHLELMDASDPRDVSETRELVLDEVDRMARLVSDLILLAKARRPDFVRPGDVDLQQLTESLLTKAKALGSRAWALDAVARGTARLDDQRVTQAVLQLAENAVKHTDEGAVVGLGSAVGPAGEVRIWVRDTGPGIPAEDRARIFDRFSRSTVRPGDEGFGLGLSIVRAIARAHGGTVTLRDVAPHGAHIEIILPQSEEDIPWPTS